jgi:phage terminase small subunit
MSGSDHPTTRRGAPRTVELLEPPAHLDEAARRAFVEARDSRPGYWTQADARLLGSYATALAVMERLERDPESASHKNEYARAMDAVLRLGRTLRLTPHSRGELSSSVPKPAMEPVSTDGLRPWQRAPADTPQHANHLDS